MIQFTDGGQLKSHGKRYAYLNCDHGGGYVSVWTVPHEKPTYLLRTEGSSEIRLIQFEDGEWAKEWFLTHPSQEILMRLDEQDQPND